MQHLKNVEQTAMEQHTDFAFYFMWAFLSLGFCAVLWFGASWLSGRIAAGAPGAEGEAPAAWSHQSALSVVVIASGLWLLILLVPSLTYVLVELFRRGGVDFISLAYAIVAAALGLVCVLSLRAIAGFISRARGM